MNRIESTPQLAEVLGAVARELGDLGAASAALQELVAERIRGGAMSDTAVMDAQAADLLVQHLSELSKFVDAYARGLASAGADPLGSALETLVLGALAQRLSTLSSTQIAPDSGKLELF